MSEQCEDGGPVINTDVHLWPKTQSPDAEYLAVLGVGDDAIGIEVGGHVVTKPIRAWFELQAELLKKDEEIARLTELASRNGNHAAEQEKRWLKSERDYNECLATLGAERMERAQLRKDNSQKDEEIASLSRGYQSAVERANDAIIERDALKSWQESIMTGRRGHMMTSWPDYASLRIDFDNRDHAQAAFNAIEVLANGTAQPAARTRYQRADGDYDGPCVYCGQPSNVHLDLAMWCPSPPTTDIPDEREDPCHPDYVGDLELPQPKKPIYTLEQMQNDILHDVADLADEAGMDEVAEELREQAGEDSRQPTTEAQTWICPHCQAENRDDYNRISCGKCNKLRPAPTGEKQCQHDLLKPSPTIQLLGSAALGSSDWAARCTVCNERWNHPLSRATSDQTEDKHGEA